jgi:hypothetical protein
MRVLRLAATAILATGCISTGDTHTIQTLNFDFNVVREGWVAGAADYAESQAAAVGAFGAVQLLPAPLVTTQNALYLRGTNVGGDLFLFQKRRFTGLGSLVTYTVSMQVEFATSYQAGCTTGPGTLTYLKAGLSDVEPLTATDGQGVVRMLVDKGAGAAAGDFLQLGDIRNTLSGCAAPGTFGLHKSGLKVQPTTLTTDVDGGFWVFIGTQSSFAGQHEIYITGMKIVLE